MIIRSVSSMDTCILYRRWNTVTCALYLCMLDVSTVECTEVVLVLEATISECSLRSNGNPTVEVKYLTSGSLSQILQIYVM